MPLVSFMFHLITHNSRTLVSLQPAWCNPTTDLDDGAYAAYASRSNTQPAADELVQGAQLLPQASLTSKNGKFQLVMQADGQLVVQMKGGAQGVKALEVGASHFSVLELETETDAETEGAPLQPRKTGGRGLVRNVRAPAGPTKMQVKHTLGNARKFDEQAYKKCMPQKCYSSYDEVKSNGTSASVL